MDSPIVVVVAIVKVAVSAGREGADARLGATCSTRTTLPPSLLVRSARATVDNETVVKSRANGVAKTWWFC